MTPEQQVLVQTSFAKVAPIADAAAARFYDELFKRNPRLRVLFKDDMAEQRRKLMNMLGTAVANLRQWEKIQAAVQDLGRRHIEYGVGTADYQTVGAALIATLEQELGADFAPNVREAWIACYAAITAQMLGTAAAA